MSARVSVDIGIVREDLAKRTRAVLNRGGWGNPDVLLVETATGSVVVKDFAPRACVVRSWFGPWLLRREARAYRRLDGVETIPRLLGQIDAAALIFEYRPGVLLSRSLAGHLSPSFLAELDSAVAEMHRRGVVHLDLRHRSNILAGEDGRPVVLDFATALLFDAATRWGRLWVRMLGAFDRRALRKWQVRLS